MFCLRFVEPTKELIHPQYKLEKRNKILWISVETPFPLDLCETKCSTFEAIYDKLIDTTLQETKTITFDAKKTKKRTDGKMPETSLSIGIIDKSIEVGVFIKCPSPNKLNYVLALHEGFIEALEEALENKNAGSLSGSDDQGAFEAIYFRTTKLTTFKKCVAQIAANYELNPESFLEYKKNGLCKRVNLSNLTTRNG